MPLIFTDSQIKELTAKVLMTDTIATQAAETEQKGLKIKQDAKEVDDGNAVYTNFYDNIIKQYHIELKYISGTQRTDMNIAQVDLAARNAPSNLHFVEGWPNFYPKLADYNNGNPTMIFTPTEPAAIDDAQVWIAYLKTGFTDGAATTTTASGFTTNTIQVNSITGFAAGQRVIFISGSNYLLTTILSTAAAVPPATNPTITITGTILLASNGTAGILTGASVRNFHPGFNLTQRETGAGLAAGELAYLNGLKAQVDAKVQIVEDRALIVQAALLANDAVAPDAAEIATARTNVAVLIAAINTWQGFPSVGAGTSRFGTNLPALETAFTTREGQYAPRIAQITNRLGTVTQDSKGAPSGMGQYRNYYDNLNHRTSAVGGTLRSFYQADLTVEALKSSAQNQISQAARDSGIFLVRKFATNGNDTQAINLTDISGLAQGQTVKVMSNTQPVITTTITKIQDLVVTLGAAIPATYTTDDLARIAKQY